MLRMTAKPFAALAALICLTAPARAWEIVGGSLPTFAQDAPSGAGSLIRPWASTTGDPFAGAPVPAGYDLRLGKGLFIGVQNWSGPMPGLASGAPTGGLGFSGSQVKLGFDTGSRLTPYLTAGFGEARASMFGGSSLFSGPALTGAVAPAGLAAPGNPFSSSASVTTLGAGFDYAITNNLTLGVGVSTTQVRPTWP